MLIAAGAAAALAGCTSRDAAAVAAAPRLGDASFEAAASSVCGQATRVFDAATTLPKSPTNAEKADLLDSIDQTFATMVQQLHQLRPAPADAPAVAAWLADWDAYVAFGRRYAPAVRTGSEGALVRDDLKSQEDLRRRLRAFAEANHMKACQFP